MSDNFLMTQLVFSVIKQWWILWANYFDFEKYFLICQSLPPTLISPFRVMNRGPNPTIQPHTGPQWCGICISVLFLKVLTKESNKLRIGKTESHRVPRPHVRPNWALKVSNIVLIWMIGLLTEIPMWMSTQHKLCCHPGKINRILRFFLSQTNNFL